MKNDPPVVHSDPEIMGGTPVFVGTRVPFQTLLDYLEAGQPLAARGESCFSHADVRDGGSRDRETSES